MDPQLTVRGDLVDADFVIVKRDVHGTVDAAFGPLVIPADVEHHDPVLVASVGQLGEGRGPVGAHLTVHGHRGRNVSTSMRHRMLRSSQLPAASPRVG